MILWSVAALVLLFVVMTLPAWLADREARRRDRAIRAACMRRFEDTVARALTRPEGTQS